MVDENAPHERRSAGQVPFDSRLARIAIVSTPRSGNSFLRMLLAQSLGLVEIPVHHPAEVSWEDLPDRAVIQLHWPRTEYFAHLLNEAQVHVVTLIRHPFDVLLSVLRFAQIEPDTREWLWGKEGNEDAYLGADPTSEAFAHWATSSRARALLDVTESWLSDPGVSRVRYDTLVHRTTEVVTDLINTWELSARTPVDAAVDRLTPRWVNEAVGLEHAEDGHGGGWQELLPSELIEHLGSHYNDYLKRLELPFQLPSSGVENAAILSRWHQVSPVSTSGWPDSLYRGSVEVLERPSVLRADSSINLRIKVQNSGTSKWPNQLRHPLIRVGYRWLDENGKDTSVLGDRCILSSSLVPGAAVEQTAVFNTPRIPGSYLVKVDLVHENVRWFGCGVALRMTIT